MEDCSKCTRTDIKCCFTCKKDAEKCKVYHHCGSDCPKHEYRKITNADKIRAMSDEKLAGLTITYNDYYGEYYCSDEERYDSYEDAIKHEIEWLQSEAE